MKVDSLLLLPLLKHINPSIQGYDILDKVTQANAEGNRILVTYKNDNKNEPEKVEEFFVKQIIATQYLHKSWADLRRTLSYARTEVRFYQEFVPEFKDIFTPRCFYATISLDGIMGEDEKVTDVDHKPPETWPLDDNQEQKKVCLSNCAGYLILQSIPANEYIQESPLTITQATKCLEAIAEMHASAWENESLLKKASMRLSDKGGSYHLSIRNPKEYHGLISSWDKFVSNFRHLDPELFAREEISTMGKRVYDLAKYISDELSPSPTDSYATIVHGDFKAMNVFLPKDNGKALIIDFASVGLGFGMSDVAMHIPHAVHPSDLENGGEELLLNSYLNALTQARIRNNGGEINNLSSYPRNEAIRHYKLASIDYLRFILGRFWKSASLETFEKRKDSPNTTFVNRNVDSAFAFIRRVETYLSEFEKEYAGIRSQS